MEEGETVEIQETREPLREQGSIRALLELLEQQGMEQEKGDVLRMADYIDSMEMQLGTVLKELGEVKKQLGVMQESKVKLFAVNTIQNAFLEAGGKEVRKLTERNSEQGIIFQTQKVLFQSMRSIHQLEQKTERLKQQAEKLEAREGKQLSVRNTLQELRQEQHHLKLGKEEKQKSAVR